MSNRHKWNVEDLINLRLDLKMSRSEFGKILGVDERSIWRWESGGSKPRGSAVSVLDGIQFALQENPDSIDEIIKYLQKNAKIGGLSFMIYSSIIGIIKKFECKEI